MKISRHTVYAFVTPVIVCWGLMFLDQLCQQPIEKLSLGGWAGVCFRSSGYGFLLAAVMLLGGRVAKWIAVVAVPVFLFIICAEFFVRRNFEWNFFGDWLLLVQATSPKELDVFAREYVISMGVSLSTFVVVAALSLWVIIRWRPPKFGFARVSMIIVFLVPFYFLDFRKSAPLKSFNSSICYKVLTDTVEFSSIYSEMGSIVAKPELPDKLLTSVPTAELPICVFIIGESMTRNNMHVYGYERDTTPFLDSIKDELCIFSDVVGVWNQTPMAVRYLFTAATYEDQTHSRYTLAQIAKRAGYPTSFYSRQGHWGALNNMVTYVFEACDKKVFLDEELSEPIYDLDILPYFKARLSETKNCPQVIFLHLYGCHYPFYHLTPDNEKIFSGEKKSLDDYDAAVRHDDKLFGEIIRELRGVDRPAVMFYVSDHGDSPRSKTWRDMSSSDMWDMPVIVWFSQKYRSNFPETVSRMSDEANLPLQNDLLLPAMIDVLQIKDTSLDVTVKGRACRYTHMWQKKYER